MARSTQKYLRNLYASPASLRLQSGRRIEFPPRGMRGDLQPITSDEAKDPAILLNIGLLVELVSQGEAIKVFEKQATNQQAVHPALDLIGQESVEMEVLIEDQGVVVAQTEDGNVVIKPGRDGGIQRTLPKSVGPNVSSNFTGSDNEMATLMASDDAAKSGTDLTSILGIQQD
ncbi:hypothetical protein [Candidatus Solirubrobacter pratensis]|uniref:hypothetical protein n=1 Tax=Candidatus Solirubrobacter pratensis TaxID=1298857 RepID=UPI0004864C16|nr:hypothetical protein [Candidatus Solirubrobacter pratensis]